MKKKIISTLIIGGLTFLGTQAQADNCWSSDKRDEAQKLCYILADQDNNGITTIDEEKQMWVDLGYHLKEYYDEENNLRFKKIWPESDTYDSEIEKFEKYMTEKKLKFKWNDQTCKYNLENGPKGTILRKKSNLRK